MKTTKMNNKQNKFSDFIVYVDESGDHGLKSINPEFPVFVLAFCIFDKQAYANQVVPSVENLKFEHFGHDLVILHERDIRKRSGDFNFFNSKDEHFAFLHDLSDVMTDNPYQVISLVVDKPKLTHKDVAEQEHPYHLALKVCLERLFAFLQQQGQADKLTHVVVEKRGKKEDADLELEFRQICDGANIYKQPLPFVIRLADKQANSSGLQFADMVARPIGVQYLNPSQKNRAYEVLLDKFWQDDSGQFEGLGLNVYPKIANKNGEENRGKDELTKG